MWRQLEYELSGYSRPVENFGAEAEDPIFAGDCNTAAPVTRGEFGDALLSFMNTFCLPDQVSQFLKLSPTFMKLAGVLDKKYLYIGGKQVSSMRGIRVWWSEWKPRDDGVLTAGPFRGRRVLDIVNGFSSFTPAGSPDTRFAPYDFINLEVPMKYWSRRFGEPLPVSSTDDIGRFVELIAHESTHAFTHVTRTKPSPAKRVDRVREFIADEGATRRNEARIVAEIKARAPAFRSFNATHQCVDRGCSRLVGGRDGPAAVERDFFPSNLSRTYLEHVVLTEMISEARLREHLTAADALRINAEVERIPLDRMPLDSYLNPFITRYYDPQTNSFKIFTSEYFKFNLWLRVIDARWLALLLQFPQGSQNFEAAKERTLQEHADAFFGRVSGIRYTPRPPQTP